MKYWCNKRTVKKCLKWCIIVNVMFGSQTTLAGLGLGLDLVSGRLVLCTRIFATFRCHCHWLKGQGDLRTWYSVLRIAAINENILTQFNGRG